MEPLAAWATATEQHELLPKKIEALAGRRVVAASAGLAHSLAITADDGAVWSWGDGREAQLGATATSGASCCRRRSRSWWGGASSP